MSSVGGAVRGPVRYCCKECDRGMGSIRGLLEHQRDFHHINFKIINCDHCTRYATCQMRELRRHMVRKHRLSSPNPCPTIPSMRPVSAAVQPVRTVEEKKKLLTRPSSFGEAEKSIKTTGSPGASDQDSGSTAGVQYLGKKTISSGVEIYSCQLCPFINEALTLVIKHVRSVHASSIRPTELVTEAMDSTTGKRVFHCNECHYETGLVNNFFRHCACHRADGPFRCIYCSYSSRHEPTVMNHLRTHTAGSEALESKQVVVKLPSATPPSNHPSPLIRNSPKAGSTKSPQRWPCPKCGCRCGSRAWLGRHLKRVHRCSLNDVSVKSSVKVEPASPPSKSQFSCPLCPLVTSRQQQLETHMKWRHPESCANLAVDDKSDILKASPKFSPALGSGPSGTKSAKASKSRPSSVCSESDTQVVRDFILPGAPVAARKRGRSETGSVSGSETSRASSPGSHVGQLHRCPHCKYTADCQSRVDRHVLGHENLRRFKCSACGQRTNYRTNIRKHITAVHARLNNVPIIVLSADEAERTLDDYIKEFKPIQTGRKMTPIDDTVVAAIRKKYLKTKSSPKKGSTRSPKKSSSGSSTPKASSSATKMKIEPVSSDETSSTQLPEACDMDYRRMCSVCGFRTNWRRSIKKHLLSHKSAERCGEIILGAEEARLSLEAYRCTPIGAIQAKMQRSASRSLRVVSAACKSHVMKVRNFGKKPASTTDLWCCSKCSFKTRFHWYYAKHLRTVHSSSEKKKPLPASTASPAVNTAEPEDRKPAAVGTVLRPYRCSECPLRSRWLVSVRKHIRSIHPTATVITESASDEPSAMPAADEPSRPLRTASGAIRKPKHGWFTDSAVDRSGFRRFACVMCVFRSNHRSSIQRHLYRHHHVKSSAGKIRILNESEAKRTMRRYLSTAANKYSITSRLPSVAVKAKKSFSASAPVSSRVLETSSTVDDSPASYSPIRSSRAEPSPGRAAKSTSVTPSRGSPASRSVAASPVPSRRVSLHLSFTDSQQSSDNLQVSSTSKNEDLTSFNFLSPSKVFPTESRSQLSIASNDNESVSSRDDRPSQSDSADNSPRKSSAVPYHLKPFACVICPFRFERLRVLERHMQIHEERPDAPFRCPHCPYFPSQQKHLKKHLEMHERFNKPQQPQQQQQPDESCGPEPPTVDDIHLLPPAVPVTAAGPQRIAGIHLLRCGACRYTTTSRAAFLSHRQMHRPRANAPYKCPHCPFWVTQAHQLRSHKLLHNTDDAGAEISADWSDDMQRITPAVEIADEVIEMAWQKQQLIACHPLQRQKSNDGIRSSSASLETLDAVTNENPEHQPPHRELPMRKPARQQWCCDRCPYATHDLWRFKWHMSLHGRQYRFQCSYCDYSVPRYWQLVLHRRLHYSVNQNILHSQSLVNLVNTLPMSQQTLAAHPPVNLLDRNDGYILRDSDSEFALPESTPFVCGQCPFSTELRTTWVAHMRRHVVVSQHRCPFCSFSAVSEKLLGVHAVVHFNLPGGNLSVLPPSAQHHDAWKQFVADVVAFTLQKSAEIDTGKTARRNHCSKPILAESNPDENLRDSSEIVIKAGLSANSSDSMTAKNSQEILVEHEKLKVTEPDDTKNSDDTGIVPAPAIHMVTDVIHECKTGVAKPTEKCAEFPLASLSELPSTVVSMAIRRLICEYCDRPFNTHDQLTRHEAAHLVGCYY